MGYTDYNTFLMFGDSITEFAFNQFPDSSSRVPQFSLGSALQNVYTRKLQVLHRGFSGYTSRDALPLAKSILNEEFDKQPDSKKIKIAYVFFGTNDARLRGLSSENNEHIPLENYLENMVLVIKEFNDRNIPVIVITPGLHDQNLWNIQYPQDLVTGDYRTNENNKLYQDKLTEKINNSGYKNAYILPLYNIMIDWIEKNGSEMAKNGDYSEILSDGIHFTGLGYEILYDAIMNIINTKIKSFSPIFMHMQFPHRITLRDHTFDQINN